jgi:hypothetical protein
VHDASLHQFAQSLREHVGAHRRQPGACAMNFAAGRLYIDQEVTAMPNAVVVQYQTRADEAEPNG